jgi:hypothetical protein
MTDIAGAAMRAAEVMGKRQPAYLQVVDDQPVSAVAISSAGHRTSVPNYRCTLFK